MTKQEEFAIQQFTGMHISEGRDVHSVCLAMGLREDEWKNIKDDCSWLTEYEVGEIEDFFLGQGADNY